MKAHVNADETYLLRVKTVLDLTKRARELFMSLKIDEKQQLLNFVFSNLKLDRKTLFAILVVPFSPRLATSYHPKDFWVHDANLRQMD